MAADNDRVTWRGHRRRTADGAAPRGPARRGTYVVRHRLRPGSLLSGALLVGSLATLTFIVLALPWLVVSVHHDAGGGAGGWLSAAVGLLFWLGFFALVAIIAGLRRGNAALRRRVLAMDDAGVWEYTSARWRQPPDLVPWHQAGPVRAITESEVAKGEDPMLGPTLVPWDHVQFGEPPRAGVHVLWLTATVEEIAAEAQRRRPHLVFLDHRTPAQRGLSGWVLRRRRRTRRRLFSRGPGRT